MENNNNINNKKINDNNSNDSCIQKGFIVKNLKTFNSIYLCFVVWRLKIILKFPQDPFAIWWYNSKSKENICEIEVDPKMF